MSCSVLFVLEDIYALVLKNKGPVRYLAAEFKPVKIRIRGNVNSIDISVTLS